MTRVLPRVVMVMKGVLFLHSCQGTPLAISIVPHTSFAETQQFSPEATPEPSWPRQNDRSRAIARAG